METVSFRVLSVAIVIHVLSSLQLHAATTVQMDLQEMVVASPNIVRGLVLSTESHWNEDHTLIVTDARIEVVDVLKGEAAREIVVTQPGGVVGKLRVEVPGATAFRNGEELILFVTAGASGRLHVTGLSQGRFDVVEDPKTGRKVVRGMSPRSIVASSKTRTPSDERQARPHAETLANFVTRIRSLVHELDAKGGK